MVEPNVRYIANISERFRRGSGAVKPAKDFDFGTKSFTIACYLRVQPGFHGGSRILSRRDAKQKGFEFIAPRPQSGVISAYVNGLHIDVGQKRIDDDVWHFITLVVDRQAGTMRAFVDNEVDGDPVHLPNTGSLSSKTKVCLGDWPLAANHEFDGDFFLVMIWNRPLSHTELKEVESKNGLFLPYEYRQGSNMSKSVFVCHAPADTDAVTAILERLTVKQFTAEWYMLAKEEREAKEQKEFLTTARDVCLNASHIIIFFSAALQRTPVGSQFLQHIMTLVGSKPIVLVSVDGTHMETGRKIKSLPSANGDDTSVEATAEAILYSFLPPLESERGTEPETPRELSEYTEPPTEMD